MSGTETEKNDDAPRPALRRDGRWLVWPNGDRVLIDRIVEIGPTLDGSEVFVAFAGGSQCKACPNGTTLEHVRALIDEALDEAAGGGGESLADRVEELELCVGGLANGAIHRSAQDINRALAQSDLKREVEQLRARVAELEAGGGGGDDGDTDNYSREQLQETLEAVAGERDRALNNVWRLEKQNRKLRDGRKGYRQAIRNLQRAYANECRCNREIRETLRVVGAKPTVLEKTVGILEVRAETAEARVAELEAQLVPYQADAPRTFSSAVPVEFSPPGRETHRGRPVLTEEECAAMPCPLPPEEPESDDIDEWKACVRAWSEWAGREVRGLRGRAEVAEARVAELEGQRDDTRAAQVEAVELAYGVGELQSMERRVAHFEEENEGLKEELETLRARVAELEGEARDPACYFGFEKAEKLLDAQSEIERLRARVAELEASNSRLASKFEAAHDFPATTFVLQHQRLEYLDARLRAVVEPARALVDAVTAWRPEAFGPDAGCRVYTAKEAGHVSAVGNALRDTRAALDAAEGEHACGESALPWQSLVAKELARAREKFPNPWGLLAALTEEVGEVARALLEHGHPSDQLAEECIQTAAMAIRILEEGDPSITSRIAGRLWSPADPKSRLDAAEKGEGAQPTETHE